MAAILADCVTRGNSSQAEADYRNTHFGLHIVEQSPYILTGIRIGLYVRPFFPTDFMLSVGAPWPTLSIPGGTVIDLALQATRDSIVSIVTAALAGYNGHGILLDTPFQYATGQDTQALDVLTRIRTGSPSKYVVANVGDLFTWTNPPAGTKQSVVSQFEWLFVQEAMDVDPNGTTLGSPSGYDARKASMLATAAAQTAAGKHLIIGLYDAANAHDIIARDVKDELAMFDNMAIYYAAIANTPPVGHLAEGQWNPAYDIPEGIAMIDVNAAAQQGDVAAVAQLQDIGGFAQISDVSAQFQGADVGGWVQEGAIGGGGGSGKHDEPQPQGL